MIQTLRRSLVAWRRRRREKALIHILLGLNDHLLADAGLRRDQLQADGIHELDVAPASRPQPRRPVPRAAVRPSFQGCG